jgi:Ca2+-binding RTX toxin-like protein
LLLPILALALLAGARLASAPQESCRRLLTPEGRATGTVCLTVRSDSLVAEYLAASGWSLMETHLAVAADLQGLPRNEGGILRLGGFLADSLSAGTQRSTHTLSLLAFGAKAGSTLAVSAQASAVFGTGLEEGVWAEGEAVSPGRHPGTWFAFTLPASAAAAGVGGAAVAAVPSARAPEPVATPGASGARGPADGTPAQDTLRGGDGRDVLFGEGGPDLIEGAGGPDWLDGGDDDDVVRGGDGDDFLDGSDGTDALEGGAGADRLFGGPGTDWLFGDDGDDHIEGGSDADVAQGGDGADRIDGGDGDDILDGESGDDVVEGGIGDDVIDGGDGIDRLYGGAGADNLDGGDDNDVLFGEDGDDTLDGTDGDDVLDGGPGDDVLDGGDGFDVLIGGAGDDALGGGDEDDLIRGGDGNDLIAGGIGGDILDGEAGVDSIFGQGGEDVLRGGLGDDLLSGGSSADLLEGGPGDDRLVGGAGADVIRGGDGDDVVTLRAGDVEAGATEWIDGGGGANVLVLYGFAADPGRIEAGRLADPLTQGTYELVGEWRVEHRATLPAEVVQEARALVFAAAPTAVTIRRRSTPEGGPADTAAAPPLLELPPFGVREIPLALGGGGAFLVADAPFAVASPVSVEGVGTAVASGFVPLDEFAVPVRVRPDRDDGFGVALAAGAVPALLRLALWSPSAQEVEARELRLAPGEARSLTLDEIFPDLGPFTGSLVVNGEGVSAAAVQRSDGASFVVPAFPLEPRAVRATLHFPAVVGEVGDTSTLVLRNPLPAMNNNPRLARGTVLFVDAEGNPTAVQVGDTLRTGFPFEVRGQSTAFHRLVRPSGSGPIGARIQVLENELQAMVLHRSAGVAWAETDAPPLTEFVAPVRGSASGPSTRVAAVAVGGPARLELRLRDADGQDVPRGTVVIDLAAGSSVSGTLGALFPDAATAGLTYGTVQGSVTEGQVAVSVVGPAAGVERAPLPVIRRR